MTIPVVFLVSWTNPPVIAVRGRGSAAVKHGFDFRTETQTIDAE